MTKRGRIGEVGREGQEGGDICLQVHRLTYKSIHLNTSPWAHVQVHALAYKSMGLHISLWARNELDMT